jgi:RHS repeat-associated protein
MLDYAVNRFYSPQQGRFTQVDPIGMGAASLGNPQTLNLYAYCVNDPVNHADPLGLYIPDDYGVRDGEKLIGFRNPKTGEVYLFSFLRELEHSVTITAKAPSRKGGGGGGGGVGGGRVGGGGTVIGGGGGTVIGGGGGGGIGGGRQQDGGGQTNNEQKPCPPTGRTSIWNGNVTTNKPTIEAGAAIGGVIGGLPGALIGAVVGSMFGVGANVSYVPSTKSVYAGPTIVFAPGFGGGNGFSVSRLSVPSSQNPNSVASGWGLTATFQPLPVAGSTVLKSPGNGPAVVGPSMGSRVPVSFGAGYNITIKGGGCP